MWMKWKFVLLLLLMYMISESGWAKTIPPEVHASMVLFDRFETVFRASSDLLSNYPSGFGKFSDKEANLFRAPYWYFMQGMGALGMEVRREVLKMSSAVLVGAKDFRGPNGLGPIRFQSCYVLVLPDISQMDIGKHLPSTHRQVYSGTVVYDWTANIREFGDDEPEKSTHFFASQIEKQFLLVCNNFEELRATTGALVSSQSDETAFKGRIPEWDSVTEHSLWGYRRYRHNNVADKMAAGMSDIGPDVDALVFLVNLEKRVCTVKLASSEVYGTTPEKLNSLNFIPRFRPVARRLWRSSYTFFDEYTQERTLFMMDLLGFGSYV